MESLQNTPQKALLRVLKKKAMKMKEQAQAQASPAQAVVSQTIPTQKREYNFTGRISLPFLTGIRIMSYNFKAFLSRNEKLAMDELINELNEIFLNNFKAPIVIKERSESLYKLLRSKINEYSLDFVKALKSLFDQLTLDKDNNDNTLFYLFDGDGVKENKSTKSIYQQIRTLINNKLNRVEAELEPERIQALEAIIPLMLPTVAQPSYESFVMTPQQSAIVALEKKRQEKIAQEEAQRSARKAQILEEFKQRREQRKAEKAKRKERGVIKEKQKVEEEYKQEELEKALLRKKASDEAIRAREEAIRARQEAQKASEEAQRAREEQERLSEQRLAEELSKPGLFGYGLNKTQKLTDLFGMLDPAVIKAKGGKLTKKQVLAMLGEGHKIKKVAKPNDARRVRGQKIKELMKNNPGMTLAMASAKLKEMKNC
jgi:hypothetical protein